MIDGSSRSSPTKRSRVRRAALLLAALLAITTQLPAESTGAKNAAEFEVRAPVYLKASNPGAGDLFGWSVSVSGDTVAVGADREDSGAREIDGDQDDDSAPRAGAVYVFVRNGNAWTQQAYLKSSNSGAGDRFGTSVALWGDTLVVGAAHEDSAARGVDADQQDDSATAAGAAYVFARSGARWIQQAYLKASNSDELDQFGASVAISGDTVVVGAALEDSRASGIDGDQDDNSATDAGAAYVFRRIGVQWHQEAYLKASNAEAGDLFGTSVAVDGNTIVVGAIGEDSATSETVDAQDDNSAEGSGAMYVFRRDGAQWRQEAYLKASNSSPSDHLGLSVSVSGGTAVGGAIGEDSMATGVNGDEQDDSASESGAAYVFVRRGESWAQQAYLKASNTQAGDDFGMPVSLNSDQLLIGAYREDSDTAIINGDQSDNSATSAGAAYLFGRNGTAWRQQAYLKASNTDPVDGFGHAVAISDRIVVVASLFEDSQATGVDGDQSDDSEENAGAAYVFDFEPGFTINPGLNDAWYNPATPGQGFVLSVHPGLGQMFLAWLTYDIERPTGTGHALLGDPGHRWLTAQGPYAGDTAELTLYQTVGGVFDEAEPAPATGPVDEGFLTIEFADCTEALLHYEIGALGIAGDIPIRRIRSDNVRRCEELAGPATGNR